MNYHAVTRSALLFSVATIGLAIPGIAAAQSASGQTASEQQAFANEIVVTATKRDQTLQDVPVAVTVTTAETIERSQIRDVKDLGSVVPSLRVGQLQSSANTNFFIRGFGNGANNAGIEPSVGVFIDGVYRSRSAAQIGDFPDVSRIEVLRGPQSTLFGKNASAGVISIVTQKPQFELGGNVEATYGNYDAVTLKGTVTGPLSETVAASISGGLNKRDGFIRDEGPAGGTTNERDRWFTRGQLLFEPSKDLSIRLIADYGKIDENCCGVVNVKTSAATGAIIGVGGQVNAASDPFGDVVYNNIPSSNKIDNYGFSGQIDYTTGPLKLTSITAWRKTTSLTNQDSDFTSADLIGRNWQDQDISTFTQEMRLASQFDGPFNFLLGGFYFNEKINQANEIQWGSVARPYANLLVGAGSGGALDLTTLEGAFGGSDYLAGLAASPYVYANQFFRAGTGLSERYRLKDEAYSLFLQADFKVSDRMTVTGGIAYNNDKKNYGLHVDSNDAFAGIDFNAPQYSAFRRRLLYEGGVAKGVGTALGLSGNATQQQISDFANAYPGVYSTIDGLAATNADTYKNVPAANPLNALRPLQFLPPILNVPNGVEPGRTKDDQFTYTARLAYDITDAVNAYVSFATGYKASSINLSRDSRPSADDAAALTSSHLTVANQTYGSRIADPEKSTVYEAGIKSNWSIGSANIAVFKQSIKGFQSNIFTGTGFALANAGKQSTFGVEFEGTLRPVSPFTLLLAVTYLDPKFDSFEKSACGSATGMTPAGIPKWSGTLGGQYEHKLGNGDKVIARANYHFESETQIADCLLGFVVNNPATGAIVSAAQGIAEAQAFRRSVNEVDASLTYALQSGLELSIWGRNLTNDRYLISLFDSPAQKGSVSGYPNQPRTYGGSIRYRF